MRELGRVAAALAAAAVLLRAFLAGPGDVRVTMLLLAAAVAVVSGLVLWGEGAVTSGAAALAAAYAGSLWIGGVAADPLAPVVAGLLVLYVEAADFAMAIPPGIPVDRVTGRNTLRRTGFRVALAVAVAAAVLLAAAAPAAPSGWLRVLGLAGAAAALAGPILLLRRR